MATSAPSEGSALAGSRVGSPILSELEPFQMRLPGLSWSWGRSTCARTCPYAPARREKHVGPPVEPEVAHNCSWYVKELC